MCHLTYRWEMYSPSDPKYVVRMTEHCTMRNVCKNLIYKNWRNLLFVSWNKLFFLYNSHSCSYNYEEMFSDCNVEDKISIFFIYKITIIYWNNYILNKGFNYILNNFHKGIIIKLFISLFRHSFKVVFNIYHWKNIFKKLHAFDFRLFFAFLFLTCML